ncbi:MAG: ABC transporter ATP-binding protein [Candidatus Tectimicrobiota bacterium]|nr:MAG: ABC transporter ATP-binding protein [Candidatus Tectomicrobia bacterium]
MVLVVDNLVVGYWRDIDVLQGVSLQAAAAQLVSVIGPNGAGKSTLLKAIVGLVPPRRGRVLFNGQDITGAKPYTLPPLGVGYVPQDSGVFASLSVQENLELGTWLFRHDRARVQQALDAVYTRFPFLWEKRRAKARTLSGGQRKMLEIGRALMTEPRLLLLDEPTVGLSPVMAKEIYRVIADLRQRHLTIVLVDQNVRQALEVADYAYVLELGRTRDEGPAAKFLSDLESVVRGWLTQ